MITRNWLTYNIFHLLFKCPIYQGIKHLLLETFIDDNVDDITKIVLTVFITLLFCQQDLDFQLFSFSFFICSFLFRNSHRNISPFNKHALVNFFLMHAITRLLGNLDAISCIIRFPFLIFFQVLHTLPVSLALNRSQKWGWKVFDSQFFCSELSRCSPQDNHKNDTFHRSHHSV